MILRGLLTVLVVIGLLPAVQVASGREAMASETALPGKLVQTLGAETVYIVEWDIQAYGHEDIKTSNERHVRHREISITGRAVVHKPANGENTAFPMELTITDDSYRGDYYSCSPLPGWSEHHTWRSITDPGRYNGGPDPHWKDWVLDYMVPYLDWDGHWYMPNLFTWGFFVGGASPAGEWRNYNYHEEKKGTECDGWTYKRSSDEENKGYGSILFALEDMPLKGDPSGTIFTLDTEYTVDDFHEQTVQFHITVSPGGCKDLTAPIDIGNPAITSLELNLQAENTTPDGQAALQASVACEGIPVVGAPVVVTLKAKPGSGGHNHEDGQRPRGYIDGMEITEKTKFIGITGRDGAVTFTIEPGRDLTDKSRGIAGLYIVEAWVEKEGFYPYLEHAYIQAGLKLVPLLDNSNLYLFNYSSGVHPKVHYGTPATVQRIQELAAFWIEVQDTHNFYLSQKGKETWPILEVVVWGVSLPKGGLFDVQAAGSGMWRPPYDRHRTGEEALLEPFYFSVPWLTTEQRLWLDYVFRELGSEYGTWFSDGGVPNNLKFTQGTALLTSPSQVALNHTSSTGPDVAAYAVLVDPAGRSVAGAGQTVIYSVGVENLAAGTVASGVELRAALPTGLSFISANPTPTRMDDPRTPVWDVGSLPDEGAPRTFDITAQVDASTAPGALLNITATAASSLDADPANNQYTDWGLMVQPAGPDLVIGTDLSGTALTAGETVTYTVQLSNDGNAPATNSWLELVVPDGITLLETDPTASAIPGGVRWEAGDLLPGEQQTFTIHVKADVSLLDLESLDPALEPVFPLAFTLEAGSNGADIDPLSNLLQVDKRVEVPGPDLLVALQAEGTPGAGVFQVGQEVSYNLRYGNFGNWEAGEVSTSLGMWPGLTLLEAQPAPTTNELDPTTGVRELSWDLGELSRGEDGAIQLRLRVDNIPEVGSIIRADIRSSSNDLNPADNQVMEVRYQASGSPISRHYLFLPVTIRP
jgi:uncharacterized repeat protein (TIGR01451 family)